MKSFTTILALLPFSFLVFSSMTHGIEIELTSAEMADIEILFPKQDNPTNSVPSNNREREQSNRLISFLDRLLNRNQNNNQVNSQNNNNNNNNNQNNQNNNNNNNNLNGQQTVASQVLASTRRNLLSSLIFIPDVNKGVDTILGGVASGNLEQVISGSFIFAPNRVQSVANTVINRVFGGQSIGNLANNNQNNNNNLNNNNKNLNQTGSGTGTSGTTLLSSGPATAQQQQQFQTLSTALNQINGGNNNGQNNNNNNNNNNFLTPSHQAQLLSGSQADQLQYLQQQQKLQLANFENTNKVDQAPIDTSSNSNSQGTQQLKSEGGNNNNKVNGTSNSGLTNLLSGVLGSFFPSTAQAVNNNINAANANANANSNTKNAPGNY